MDERTVLVVYLVALAVVAVFVVSALGWLGAQTAARKGYPSALGALVCIVLGPAGLALMVVLPDLRLRRQRRVLDAVDEAVFPDRFM